LLPGDSTREAELIWRHQLAAHKIQNKIHVIVLGHHGSKTSTSDELLDSLGDSVLMGVTSARKKRYGHPHKTVTKRLQKNSISTFSTEAWGTIRFEL
jgi:competence protein ComEC